MVRRSNIDDLLLHSWERFREVVKHVHGFPQVVGDLGDYGVDCPIGLLICPLENDERYYRLR